MAALRPSAGPAPPLAALPAGRPHPPAPPLPNDRRFPASATTRSVSSTPPRSWSWRGGAHARTPSAPSASTASGHTLLLVSSAPSAATLAAAASGQPSHGAAAAATPAHASHSLTRLSQSAPPLPPPSHASRHASITPGHERARTRLSRTRTGRSPPPPPPPPQPPLALPLPVAMALGSASGRPICPRHGVPAPGVHRMRAHHPSFHQGYHSSGGSRLRAGPAAGVFSVPPAHATPPSQPTGPHPHHHHHHHHHHRHAAAGTWAECERRAASNAGGGVGGGAGAGGGSASGGGGTPLGWGPGSTSALSADVSPMPRLSSTSTASAERTMTSSGSTLTPPSATSSPLGETPASDVQTVCSASLPQRHPHRPRQLPSATPRVVAVPGRPPTRTPPFLTPLSAGAATSLRKNTRRRSALVELWSANSGTNTSDEVMRRSGSGGAPGSAPPPSQGFAVQSQPLPPVSRGMVAKAIQRAVAAFKEESHKHGYPPGGPPSSHVNTSQHPSPHSTAAPDAVSSLTPSHQPQGGAPYLGPHSPSFASVTADAQNLSSGANGKFESTSDIMQRTGAGPGGSARGSDRRAPVSTARSLIDAPFFDGGGAGGGGGQGGGARSGSGGAGASLAVLAELAGDDSMGGGQLQRGPHHPRNMCTSPTYPCVNPSGLPLVSKGDAGKNDSPLAQVAAHVAAQLAHSGFSGPPPSFPGSASSPAPPAPFPNPCPAHRPPSSPHAQLSLPHRVSSPTTRTYAMDQNVTSGFISGYPCGSEEQSASDTMLNGDIYTDALSFSSLTPSPRPQLDQLPQDPVLQHNSLSPERRSSPPASAEDMRDEWHSRGPAPTYPAPPTYRQAERDPPPPPSPPPRSGFGPRGTSLPPGGFAQRNSAAMGPPGSAYPSPFGAPQQSFRPLPLTPSHPPSEHSTYTQAPAYSTQGQMGTAETAPPQYGVLPYTQWSYEPTPAPASTAPGGSPAHGPPPTYAATFAPPGYAPYAYSAYVPSSFSPPLPPLPMTPQAPPSPPPAYVIEEKIYKTVAEEALEAGLWLPGDPLPPARMMASSSSAEGRGMAGTAAGTANAMALASLVPQRASQWEEQNEAEQVVGGVLEGILARAVIPSLHSPSQSPHSLPLSHHSHPRPVQRFLAESGHESSSLSSSSAPSDIYPQPPSGTTVLTAESATDPGSEQGVEVEADTLMPLPSAGSPASDPWGPARVAALAAAASASASAVAASAASAASAVAAVATSAASGAFSSARHTQGSGVPFAPPPTPAASEGVDASADDASMLAKVEQGSEQTAEDEWQTAPTSLTVAPDPLATAPEPSGAAATAPPAADNAAARADSSTESDTDHEAEADIAGSSGGSDAVFLVEVPSEHDEPLLIAKESTKTVKDNDVKEAIEAIAKLEADGGPSPPQPDDVPAPEVAAGEGSAATDAHKDSKKSADAPAVSSTPEATTATPTVPPSPTPTPTIPAPTIASSSSPQSSTGSVDKTFPAPLTTASAPTAPTAPTTPVPRITPSTPAVPATPAGAASPGAAAPKGVRPEVLTPATAPQERRPLGPYTATRASALGRGRSSASPDPSLNQPTWSVRLPSAAGLRVRMPSEVRFLTAAGTVMRVRSPTLRHRPLPPAPKRSTISADKLSSSSTAATAPSTPATANASTPTPAKSSIPTTAKSSAPATAKSSAPTPAKVSTPASAKFSTPATAKSSTPAAKESPAPPSTLATAPAPSVTSATRPASASGPASTSIRSSKGAGRSVKKNIQMGTASAGPRGRGRPPLWTGLLSGPASAAAACARRANSSSRNSVRRLRQRVAPPAPGAHATAPATPTAVTSPAGAPGAPASNAIPAPASTAASPSAPVLDEERASNPSLIESTTGLSSRASTEPSGGPKRKKDNQKRWRP